MRESVHGSLTRGPHSGLWDTSQTSEISTNIISLKYVSLNEEGQQFRGRSALLIGIKEERPGKHLQLTSTFSIGTQIPKWVNVPWKYPALRNKKQSAKINPMKSHRPYRTWVKNQVALLLWVKHDEHSTEKQNWPEAASNAMFASWVNPIKTAGGNGTKKQKTFLSETTLCSGRLSTIIIFRE